jgi:hypothetical protein
MSVIADIAVGKTGGAEIFFLVAVILCVLVVLAYVFEPVHRLAPAAFAAAVGCIAFGLLLL